MSIRNLYAVLAGIDSYQSPVRKLEGCVYDVNQWKTYLQTQTDAFLPEFKILLNEEVTKEALTSSLTNALKKANASDVVFFFYSGHGTREAADPVFSETEQDEALESLVCHDSIKYDGPRLTYDLLSDKELHYILSKNSNPGTHILMVFDCCHSGGMTRNSLLAENNGECIERRHLPKETRDNIAPMRRWEKFLFANEINREAVELESWHDIVPQRSHITLSACQNDESAFEQSGRGIFTSNIIDVLQRSKGALSYYDLQSRVRMYTQNQYRQTPEIYTTRDHEDDLLKTFLDKHSGTHGFCAHLFYKQNEGWCIDMGALHGVTTCSGPVQLSDDPSVEFDIKEVHPVFTRMDVDKKLKKQLSEDETYTVILTNQFSGNAAFYVDTQSRDDQILKEIFKKGSEWLRTHGAAFSFTDSRHNAAYVITSRQDKIMICLNDDQLRPVTEIPLTDSNPLARTLQYIRHIGQWEYIRLYDNPANLKDKFPVQINFYHIENKQTRKEIFAEKNTIHINEQKATSDNIDKLKISITNRSKHKYYCAILYLSNTFQIYGNMLDGKVIGLSPGETAWVYNGEVVELELEPHIKEFNFKYSTCYLKLLGSTKDFRIEALEQSALPAPTLRQKKGVDEGAARGIKTREEKAEKNVTWFSRTITVQQKNHEYNPNKTSNDE